MITGTFFNKSIQRSKNSLQAAICKLITVICLAGLQQSAGAQGIHFSQYYNAPMLLNPANTALMADNDFRVGANYRNQWASIPVPYKTFSVYGDFQLLRNRNETNWLGVGVAVFNDKAGNGDLSYNKIEGFAAYHLNLGMTSMISLGLSGGYVQRKVDLNKLTFDQQWDGFAFDGSLPNGENPSIQTNYVDIGAGINYAYFPNDDVYLKAGVGFSHINQPNESFYDNTNKVTLRPTVNLDARLRLNPTVILNPSLYFTTQQGAYEFLFGSLAEFYMGGNDRNASQLILGGFYRVKEAAVPAIGYDISGFRMMMSYDVTLSQLTPYTHSRGAFEISFRYMGLYGNGGSPRHLYNCPRFF